MEETTSYRGRWAAATAFAARADRLRLEQLHRPPSTSTKGGGRQSSNAAQRRPSNNPSTKKGRHRITYANSGDWDNLDPGGHVLRLFVGLHPVTTGVRS